MNTLKSMVEFQKEGFSLNSKELQLLNGGGSRTWTLPTCKHNCDDRLTMQQDYLWTGSGWIADGPAYQIDFCYVDAACLVR
jgi:hypothetical protein